MDMLFGIIVGIASVPVFVLLSCAAVQHQAAKRKNVRIWK